MITPGLTYRTISEDGGRGVRRKHFAVVALGLLPHVLRWGAFAAASDAVAVTNTIGEEIKRAPGRWEAATIEAIKQKSFELAVSPGAKAADVKALFSLVLKSQAQELSERRVRLLEGVKETEMAVRRDTRLTPEEKERRMREIFGLPPLEEGA